MAHANHTKESVIKMLAERVIAGIKANTTSGRGQDGRQFKPYSTRPLLIPYSRIYDTGKLKQDVLGSGRSRGELVYFSGGYRQYREMMGLQVEHVDLCWTGFMLSKIALTASRATLGQVKIECSEGADTLERELLQALNDALQVYVIIENAEVEIGFLDKRADSRAKNNIKLGRDFLGLSEDEMLPLITEICTDILGAGLDN